MPLKRRVFHHALFLVAERLEAFVCSRLSFTVALLFEAGITRDFHDRFGDTALRIVRPWLSVGTVRVSAGGVMLKMSS
jgi:hypothetical protein